MRMRGPIDETDPPDLKAIRAEMQVRHPRRDGTAKRPFRPDREDWDTEHVYIHGALIHEGSQYGGADHVARWLYAYGYRAGGGLKEALDALDDYQHAIGTQPCVLAKLKRPEPAAGATACDLCGLTHLPEGGCPRCATEFASIEAACRAGSLAAGADPLAAEQNDEAGDE